MADKTTQFDVAQAIGISKRQVQNLLECGTFPKPQNGNGYDIPACIQAYIATKTGTDTELDLTKERALLARSQRERVDLDLQVRRGRVIETDLAMRVVGKILEAMRAKMLSLPTKATPVVCNLETQAEVRDALKGYCDDMLTECAEPDLVRIAVEQVGMADADNGDDGTTAQPDDKRVGRPKKATKQRK
jgi:phage terminase Nu1 subunit (DNA packaging protein)